MAFVHFHTGGLGEVHGLLFKTLIVTPPELTNKFFRLCFASQIPTNLKQDLLLRLLP